MLCAISCHQVIRNIMTPAMPNDNGQPVPYLAESITPNDDYTEWTITARSVSRSTTARRWTAQPSPRTSHEQDWRPHRQHLRPVDTVTVDPADPMTVVIKINTSWAAFPFSLMGQASTPCRRLAPGQRHQRSPAVQPVCTGPFVFESYKPNE